MEESQVKTRYTVVQDMRDAAEQMSQIFIPNGHPFYPLRVHCTLTGQTGLNSSSWEKKKTSVRGKKQVNHIPAVSRISPLPRLKMQHAY